MKKVSVIGIGKLGLCFSLSLERSGYRVIGVDVNEEYVEKINNRTLTSHEQGVEEHLKYADHFYATTSVKDALVHSDMIFVIVATPSLASGRYDHTQVDKLVEKLITFGKQEEQKHFIVCCTTLPGYCDQVADRLKDYNYIVSYNPEFIAQGTILRDQANPDMILIGEGSTQAGTLIQEIYEDVCKNNPPVHKMSRTSAELTKLALNCFLTTKITFANMIGDIAITMGAEQDKILKAIGDDSRVGNKYLKYGFGYGGPCFPRDNRALAIVARDNNIKAAISEATDDYNKLHLKFQIEQFQKETTNLSPCISEVTEAIVISPVSYKEGSAIIEESQQLAYAVGLAELGYHVVVADNKETIKKVKQIHGTLFEYVVKNEI